jgi:starvation-inducible DNA-binding protein
LKIDETAERILTPGETPEDNYTRYKETAPIKESSEVSDGLKAVEDILHSFTVIITHQREIPGILAGINDLLTNALMSDYILARAKLVWMYSAFLNR